MTVVPARKPLFHKRDRVVYRIRENEWIGAEVLRLNVANGYVSYWVIDDRGHIHYGISEGSLQPLPAVLAKEGEG